MADLPPPPPQLSSKTPNKLGYQGRGGGYIYIIIIMILYLFFQNIKKMYYKN